MTRAFDGELANQPGASYRSENNDWSQDWLTNRAGAGAPSVLLAYGTYFDTNDDLFKVRDSGNTTSYSIFDDEGHIRTRNGLVGAPSHSFQNDSTTGAYLSSVGVYALAVAGVQVFNSTSSAFQFSTTVTWAGTSGSPLVLYRQSSTGSHYLVYQAYNASSAQTTYAQVGLTITTATAGAEVGSYVVRLAAGAGTVDLHTTFAGAGSISTGTAATQITNTTGTLRHAAIEQNSATSGQVLAWNGSTWAPASSGSGTVTGSGTTGFVPVFTASGAIGNSIITSDATGATVNGHLSVEGILYCGLSGSPSVPITNAIGEVLLSALEQGGATSTQVLAWNGTTWAPASATAGSITGSGTTGTIPMFTASGAIGNSDLSTQTVGLNRWTTLAGAGAGNGSYLFIGASDSEFGGIWLYGNNAAAPPEITFFNPADNDGTYDHFRIQPNSITGATLDIGPSTDADLFQVGAAGVILTAGVITARSDADSNHIIGRVRLDTRTTDIAHGSHFDMSGATQYAWYQNASGQTRLNAASGQTVGLYVAGTAVITASGSAVTFAQPLTINSNTDVTTTLGRVLLDSRAADVAYLSHFDMTTTGNYALKQSAVGATVLNAATGQSVSLAINNAEVVGIAAAAVVFNESGADVDVRFETTANINTLFVDGGQGRVGIGTGAPSYLLHVSDAAADSNPYFAISNDARTYGFGVQGALGDRFVIDDVTGGTTPVDIGAGALTRCVRMTTTGVVINEDGTAALDFRVESDTMASCLFVDSSANVIGINQASPNTNAIMDFGGTKPIILPRLTTAQKNAVTAVEGMCCFDTDTNTIQTYSGTAWL